MVSKKMETIAASGFVDSHCHIDFAAFDEDRNTVIESACANGVKTIIVPAVDAASWLNCIAVCQRYRCCQLALGMHPMFIAKHQPQHLADLDRLLTLHKPKAVGEIGLDFYHKHSDKDKQYAYFDKQLIIAKRHRLPVIIHNRKAHDECIQLLQERKLCGGIIHAFNGSLQHAEKYIEMGFLLGFGGMLTYERSSKLRRLAEVISLDNIVLETDAPDMVVAQHRGSRNSPEYIPHVARSMADIKNTTLAQVAETTTHNIEKLFSL